MHLWRRYNIWLGRRLLALPSLLLPIAAWSIQAGDRLLRKHAEDPQQRLDLGDD